MQYAERLTGQMAMLFVPEAGNSCSQHRQWEVAVMRNSGL
jgi:hypothetical protein